MDRSSLPPIVFRFIAKLSIHQKKAFTFCTQLLFSGDGAAYGGRQLEKKGFVVLWQEHFLMPNNITDLRFFDHKKPYDYAKIECSVRKKAARLTNWILMGKEHRKGSNWGSLFLGLLQRGPFEAMNPNSLSQAVRIDSKRCVMCGVCVSLCPVINLQRVEDAIVPQNNCTLCYRCVNHCPANAIRITAKSYVKYPYLGPTKGYLMASVQTDNRQRTDKQ